MKNFTATEFGNKVCSPAVNSLEEIVELLNEKYKKIKGFHTYATNNVVKGGFHKMNYDNTPQGEYYFRETFVKKTDSHSYQELFDLADKTIQYQLKDQKHLDELFAKEVGCKLVYKFNYSLIENEN